MLHFQLPVCLQTTRSQVKRGNGGVPKSGCVTPSSWDSALEAPEAEGQTSPGRELPRKQQRRRLLETQKRPGSCPTSARSCGTRRISGKPSPAGRLAQPPSSSRAPTRIFPAGERYPALREALGALRRASRRQLGKAGAPGPRLFLPQRFTGVSTTTRVSNGQTWGKRVAGGDLSQSKAWMGGRTNKPLRLSREELETSEVRGLLWLVREPALSSCARGTKAGL